MLEKLKGLLKLFNSKAPEAEVNLAAYAFGIVGALAVLAYWTHIGPRDGSLAAAFASFCAAITTGLWKKGSNAAEPPKGDKP